MGSILGCVKNRIPGLQYRRPEEAVVPPGVRCQLQTHTCSTRRFSKYGDLGIVASESCNILLHPMHCEALVAKASVGQPFTREFIGTQEAYHDPDVS